MQFNEVFRDNLTCDNIKSHKNQGFTLSQENTISEKLNGCQIDPPALRVMPF